MAWNVVTRNYLAEAIVPPHRIVKPGAADGSVIAAAAATDALMGISDMFQTEANERIDVAKSGTVDVEYGGTVARGNPLTADAVGRAIAAAPAAGANVRIIGFAEVSGVAGDIGECFVSPGLMQG